MSLEQAILEHASALRQLAVAITLVGDKVPTGNWGQQPVVEAKAEKYEKTAEDWAEGLNKEADERWKNTKGESAKADAELETAVQQVEQDAQEEAAPLDYKADVRPVLLALNKAKGADALKGLLGKYGAANGDKLDAEHYAAIVEDAKALIG